MHHGLFPTNLISTNIVVRMRCFKMPSMNHYVCMLVLLSVITLSSGCQSALSVASYTPFRRSVKTSYETPAKRIAAVEEKAELSDGTDSAAQQELVKSLAMKLPSENDPLVREAILKSCSAYRTPLAKKALIAGLQDENRYVRQTCCIELGNMKAAEAVDELSRVAQADEVFDVRLAAAKALGETGSSAAQKGLVAVLEDSNPAMQLTGVEAMRNLTGQDLGNNVAAYAAIAKGESPAAVQAAQPVTAVANRRDWFPFF